MEEDPNAFLMGSGKTPSLSWRNAPIGKTYKGTIARDSRVMDQRSVDTGEVIYWDEEKTRPRKMLVVYLQTGVIDHETEDHDGVWAWYVKGKSATEALKSAVRASGRPGLEIGGTVSVTFTGEGTAKTKAYNPPKLFMVSYLPPADSSAEWLQEPGEPRSALAGVAAGQQATLRAAVNRSSAEPPF